jgi:regulator of sirC expression with transglutaminase-like and TPR domain
MTDEPDNSVEALERRIDELAIMFVAVAKDQSMTRAERQRELRRLSRRIMYRDAQLERARRSQETADVILDLAETPLSAPGATS